MINRGVFRTIQELKEYETFLFHTREFGSRTPRPVVSPYGPHYRMYPELSRPAYGIIISRSTPYLAASALPAYVAVSATEAYPHISGRMYQSVMSGQVGIGSAGQSLIYDPTSFQQTSSSVWQDFKESMLNPFNW